MNRKAIVLGWTFAFLIVLSMPVQSLNIVSLYDADGEIFGPFDFVDLGTVLANDANTSVNLMIEQYTASAGSALIN